MKPESLHVLLIDRELGELPAESLELLEAWLAEHPESAGAVSSVRLTLQTTRAAVRRFPELARPEPGIIAYPVPRLQWVPLACAASILMGLAVWLGFRAGHESGQTMSANSPGELPISATHHDDPWARYALVPSPLGGMTAVRRDIHPQLEQ